jgi:hypothetical protein
MKEIPSLWICEKGPKPEPNPGAVGMCFYLSLMGRADNDPVLGTITPGCGALVLAVWFILQKKKIGTA